MYSPRIATLIAELDEALTEQTWRACVRGGLAAGSDEDLVSAQAKRWRGTWQALGLWFGGSDGQARRLRRQLRDVVAPWARNTQFLMQSGGVVTRRAELIELATEIDAAPDDATAWRIWDTAVGGFASRHLLLPADDPDDHTSSWSSAPSAPVAARYRAQGPRAVVGRRPRRADFAAGREVGPGRDGGEAAPALRRRALPVAHPERGGVRAVPRSARRGAARRTRRRFRGGPRDRGRDRGRPVDGTATATGGSDRHRAGPRAGWFAHHGRLVLRAGTAAGGRT